MPRATPLSKLAMNIAPDVHGNEGRRRLAGSAIFFDHIRTSDRIGRLAYEESLADVSSVLGSRFADKESAHVELRSRIDKGSITTTDALIAKLRENIGLLEELAVSIHNNVDISRNLQPLRAAEPA